MTPAMRAMLGEVPEPMRPLLPEVAVALGRSLAEAREWVAAGDALAAAKAVHELKGAVMLFSLSRLAVDAAEAEALLFAGDVSGAMPHLEKFSALLQELEDELRGL